MSEDAFKQDKKNHVMIKNLILSAIVIGLTVIPLSMLRDAEFGGSDDKAEAAITEINSNYTAWFSPIWEPPSAEVESLLFSLQAAVGSGIIFYGLGYMRGRKKQEDATKE
ncbi:cobalamin biosynthesis protein CbiN [Anaerosporomusa subterranea]|jgi:cobalt/nickel transport protein|uniref:Cobalt transport protein CbiN n=1 Tax=Anaerosporomusa subterranea TaxID=1794912 RepID=A0A154BRX7_ANASB|nr:energy-coupling factor ABC transporter substrate-binding protein [Anaerosporomusa subterranea]KYZ76706.1 cobalamin biosynthesis protein CbiN [Anaerosporomusa subterranea]